MNTDLSKMINHKDKDRSASKEREQKLNEFQDWLMSGIIDPQRAKDFITKKCHFRWKNENLY